MAAGQTYAPEIDYGDAMIGVFVFVVERAEDFTTTAGIRSRTM
ncbi:hypothetical protein [Novosphingobium resinovorum]|nr:hypothetical protein [Novosphingobium resinovorum]